MAGAFPARGERPLLTGVSFMTYFLGLVAVAIALGLYLNWQLTRQKERTGVLEAMQALNADYARAAGEVVDLFEAVERAREGVGRTHAAFAAVERAFAAASATFREASDLVEEIKQGFSRGNLVPLRQNGGRARAVLQNLAAELQELQDQLEQYKERWQAAPAEVAEARQAVSALAAAAAQAEAALGFPLPQPVRDTLARLEQFMAAAETEALTNPVAAARKAADLQQNLERYSGEIELYQGGGGAITQAARELTELQQAPTAGHPDVAPHLVTAAAALGELRPHLAAGKLEHFQQRLLEFHNALRAARKALRDQGNAAVQ